MTSDIALLDFDGYICKAYYATISKGSTDFDEMLALLEELVESTKSKIDKDADINYYISGHTYKKTSIHLIRLTERKTFYLGSLENLLNSITKIKLLKLMLKLMI